jgi:DNA-binding transcriptional LysR family regulator
MAFAMDADPEWNDLRVILALGRAGSVAGAARFLGVDGSTVSRRLSLAEKAFGATLIVRGGREFSFTAEGSAAFAAAETMEAAVIAARAAVRSTREELAGVVRIACPPVAIAFLSPFQEAVTVAHPGLAVELLSGRAPVDLAKGEADISIRAVRPTDLDLAVAHTFDLGAGVYAASSYLAAHGRPATHEDVRGHKLVRYADAFLHLPAFNWIERFAPAGAPAVRVDSTDLARTLIASRSGIGVLYCVAGDAEPALERVFPEPIDLIGMNIAYHQSMRGSVRVRTVLDRLIAYHVENRTRLSGRWD